MEVIEAVGGVSYAAAAQGGTRFRIQAPKCPEMEPFANHRQSALGS